MVPTPSTQAVCGRQQIDVISDSSTTRRGRNSSPPFAATIQERESVGEGVGSQKWLCKEPSRDQPSCRP
ncbi:hypothetical protein VTK73DRAFT_2870 [Phialemonium thermophilum]|uniref:Uncharacterized protein n=1 Tax=Phialemonium thermophilum TaxID=223376 RepID=A0ABR3VNT7_9PEZI